MTNSGAYALLGIQVLLQVNSAISLLPVTYISQPYRGRSSVYKCKRKQFFTNENTNIYFPRFNRRTAHTHLECSDGKEDYTSALRNATYTTTSSGLESAEATNSSFTSANEGVNRSSRSTPKWTAGNFERDYKILQTALAKQNSLSNLQQLQRKYTLDHGFIRRPLFKDLFRLIVNIGSWSALLVACRRAGTGGWAALNQSILLWRKVCTLISKCVTTLTIFHYWIAVLGLPLFLLTWKKVEVESETTISGIMQQSQRRRGLIHIILGRFGPSALVLDAYFKDPRRQTTPSFFYSKDSVRKSTKRDTKDFVLCLLENWSSAIMVSFMWSVLVAIPSLTAKSKCQTIAFETQLLPTLSRVITRVGAVAAVHQYPSLLFELQRKDQPHPLCRPTSIMRWAINNLLYWVPLGTSVDLAALFTSSSRKQLSNISSSYTWFLFSIIGPVCHLVSFSKLIQICKCNNIPLSHATSFPKSDCMTEHEPENIRDNQDIIKWRYQILWRTPQRISQTIANWFTYFVTNHKPLLYEMDEWKSVIRHDGFSTEGIQFKNQNQDHDELLANKDEILESLSLIFRDRKEALNNATQARFMKHQESYDSKELDDVLGVAIQQTFGLGISYDFEHFDPPLDENEVSIHQLRARMAKSAIREKKNLDKVLSDELALLHRLKGNVSTGKSNDITGKETRALENEIRDRYNIKVSKLKSALMTMIPTNAGIPESMEKFDSPIMIAEYVNVTAPVERGELKTSVLEAPDPLLAVEEYTRREFGDEAAEVYRENELAFRQKEREIMNDIRQRHIKSGDESIEDTQ